MHEVNLVTGIRAVMSSKRRAVRPSDCGNVAKMSNTGKTFKAWSKQVNAGPHNSADKNFGVGFKHIKVNVQNLNSVFH
jgi:hypothetical protein